MSRSSQSGYSDVLVQRVNESYHDAINERYHDFHPEILEQEAERWQRLVGRFLERPSPVTVLDIGTGTGFVPLTIAGRLGREDMFICSDISQGMLEAAERKLKEQPPVCRLRFVKLPGGGPSRLPFEAASVDVVTINSVLHHIADTDAFLAEVDRVLRAEGLLFMGHEPNKRFCENRLLWFNHRVLESLTQPKVTIFRMAEKLRLEGVLKAFYHRARPSKRRAAEEYADVIARVNQAVVSEGLVDGPMSVAEVERIVDIKDREGFMPEELLPGYRVLHSETYNHLLWVSIRHDDNRFVQGYERLLARRYRESGATFFAVLQKGQA